MSNLAPITRFPSKTWKTIPEVTNVCVRCISFHNVKKLELLYSGEESGQELEPMALHCCKTQLKSPASSMGWMKNCMCVVAFEDAPQQQVQLEYPSVELEEQHVCFKFLAVLSGQISCTEQTEPVC